MTELACEQCGGQNPAGASVCRSCGYYLGDTETSAPEQPEPADAWEDESDRTQVIGKRSGLTPTRPPPGPARPRQPTPPVEQTRRIDPVPSGAPTPNGQDQQGFAKPPRVSVPEPDVTLDLAKGTGFDLRVFNPSSIVEAYRVDALNAPPWLTISQPTIRLLPGDQSVSRIELAVRPKTLAIAQRLQLRLRVRALTDEEVFSDAEIALTVPPVGGPATIRTDPAVIRLKDTTQAQFTVHLDNPGCNHPQRYEMSGSDDEGAVRFTFTPASVEVPPGGKAVVRVQIESPAPGPGETASRQLKIRGTYEQVTVEAIAALVHQSAAADAPVRLRLEPAALRTRDGSTGEIDVIIDNRTGTRGHRVVLRGRDPEDAIRFAFRTVEMGVPAGSETRVRVRLSAPVPPPGDEASRQFTITAVDGSQESEVSGTWTQAASTAAIRSAAIRLEPEHVRVRDQTGARFGVVVDNSQGSRPLRVRLSASDPEGVVGYGFNPPFLEIRPGGSARALLTVSAPPPQFGEEAVRQLRVRAADENGMVEASGVFEQSTSPTPLSTARIMLDPQQVVAARNSRNGRFNVQVDNKRGAMPLRVRLSGGDPERAVRFAFDPGVLEIPPGQVAWSAARISAPRPGSGEQLTRPIKVVADDGMGSIEAMGSFAQSSGELRPILRILLTLLGALLVASGAILAWISGDPDTLVPTPANVTDSVSGVVTDIQDGGAQPDDVVDTAQPVERTGALVMAALMAIGLLGPKGRLTRVASAVAGLMMIAVLVFYAVIGQGSIDIGSTLIILGAIIGYIGGRLVQK